MVSSPDSEEIARIERAYARYASDPRELRRRDPSSLALRAMVEEWQSRLATKLASRGLPDADSRVLDIGCGTGQLLERFVELGADPAHCVGIDLVAARIEAASSRVPGATLLQADATEIPVESDSFDLVSMSMVVSSVLSERVAAKICSEATRVLASKGVIVWYDTRYANPLNRDVRGVGVREIRRLFPGFSRDLESITLLPPLARALGRANGVLYRPLAALPPLRARYFGLLSPRTSHETT